MGWIEVMHETGIEIYEGTFGVSLASGILMSLILASILLAVICIIGLWRS